jgi:hypothetical protein
MSAAKHIVRGVLKRLFDPVAPGGTVSSLRIRYLHLKWVRPNGGAARRSMISGRKGRGRAMPRKVRPVAMATVMRAFTGVAAKSR